MNCRTIDRYLLEAALTAAMMLSVTSCNVVEDKKIRAQREAAYKSALQEYIKNVQVGLTRKEVGDYLRVRNTDFFHMGWTEERVEDKNALATVVKIGQEEPPWYCEWSHVYIAFEFDV